MKTVELITSVLLLSSLCISATQADSVQSSSRRHRLMPVPANVAFHTGRLKIDSSFTVLVKGHSDARLEGVIHRVSRRLEGRTGFEFPRAAGADLQSATLLIQCDGPGKPVPSVEEDESYSLDVSDKQAVLK